MDDLRVFTCLLEGRQQAVEIVDVIVYNECIYLIVTNKAGRSWVMRVAARGLNVAHPDDSKEVLGLHELEMLRLGAAKEGLRGAQVGG